MEENLNYCYLCNEIVKMMFAIGFMQCAENSSSYFKVNSNWVGLGGRNTPYCAHCLLNPPFQRHTSRSFSRSLCLSPSNDVCVIESCYAECGDILLELTLVKQNYVYIVYHLESFVCVGLVSTFLCLFIRIIYATLNLSALNIMGIENCVLTIIFLHAK